MLLYFVLGILFITLGVPILQALSSIVSAWSEYIVYLFAFKIFGLKKEMGQEEEEEDESNPIGFSVSAIGDEIPIEPDQEQE